MAKRTAIIDLGSNGIRMAIFEKTSRYGFYILNEQKVKFRLGQGSYDKNNELLDKQINKAYEIIKNFHNQALNYKCRKIFCIGTSALRDAKNKDILIKKLKYELGLNIKTISGEEEAFLGGFGAINLLPEFNSNVITLDIGGGSAELCLINKNRIIKTFSLDLGTVRLKDLYQEKYKKMEDFINEKLTLLPSEFIANTLITIGGSLRAISSAIMEKNNYPLKQVHAFKYDINDEEDFIKKILNCKAAELGNLGIKKDRFDTIKIGVLVFLKIVKKLKIKHIITSGAGVREGVFLKDLFKRHNSFPINFNPSLKSLEDRFLNNKTNATVKNVRKLFLALQNFHYIDVNYLKHLEYAAKLYNIGNFLSFYSKHKHSSYIILNGLNFKITHTDKALIATIVEQHGKKINYNNIKVSHLLPNENIVNWLNYILAFCVNLNKNNDNLVYNFYFDEKTLIIKNNVNFIKEENILKLHQPKSFNIKIDNE